MRHLAIIVLLAVGCGKDVSRAPEKEPAEEATDTSTMTYEAAGGAGMVFVPICGFTVVMPGDVVEKPSNPVDSCIANFVTPACEYNVDFGQYSDSLSEFEGESVMIGERMGKLVTGEPSEYRGENWIGIHFPETMEFSSDALTMTAACETAGDLAEAEAVFRSIVLSQ